jgi:hypothetical protein
LTRWVTASMLERPTREAGDGVLRVGNTECVAPYVSRWAWHIGCREYNVVLLVVS